MTPRRPPWRYLAHRTGLLCSPSLLGMGVPFSHARHRARLADVRAEGDRIRADAYRTAAREIEAHQATYEDDDRAEFGAVDYDTETGTKAVRSMADHLRRRADQIHPSTEEPRR